MRTILAAIFLICGTTPLAAAENAQSLFNGKTLAGWEGNTKMFRVADGAIVAGSLQESIPHNEFLCTEAEYGDFELTLKARLLGEGNNAGVQFRSQRVPNHHEVKGYQCDIGRSGAGLIWGALYDESRRNKFLTEIPYAKLDKVVNERGWNELRIRCEGPHIQIWVNDQPTVDYTEADLHVPQTGKIALQIHGGPPAQAEYKEIVLKKLGE